MTTFVGMTLRLAIFSCLLLSFSTINAQELDFGDTYNTNTEPSIREGKRKKPKRMLSWIKNDPKNTLMGNKCFDEFTKSLGFEYVLQPRGEYGNRSEFSRLMHNLRVKLSLTFKNGPFWKFKLKKKRRECRKDTGDFMG